MCAVFLRIPPKLIPAIDSDSAECIVSQCHGAENGQPLHSSFMCGHFCQAISAKPSLPTLGPESLLYLTHLYTL